MARPLHTPTPNASGHHRPSRSASRAPSRPDCSFCLRDQVITSRRPLPRGVWRHARMGRARVGGDEMEKVNMADVLQLLLPRPGNIGAQVGHGMGRARVFKCKTCNRSFPTFQALGGHSTSHRKPKPPGGVPSNAKPKMHECSICGLEFAMGQALGGHMRRHRGELEATSSQRRCVEKPSHLDDGSVCLDLNQLPPMDEEEVVDVDDDDDVELLTLGLGIQLGQKVPLQVGCMGCSAITY